METGKTYTGKGQGGERERETENVLEEREM
jgi:hypothetical protein